MMESRPSFFRGSHGFFQNSFLDIGGRGFVRKDLDLSVGSTVIDRFAEFGRVGFGTFVGAFNQVSS